MPELLTTEEAAAVLRLSPHTLKKWRRLRTGPEYRKVGRRVVYRVKDLNSYIDAAFERSSWGG